MTDVRCEVTRCPNNKNGKCKLIRIQILESPTYPDLAYCDNLEQPQTNTPSI